jgi:hypothetical protein
MKTWKGSEQKNACQDGSKVLLHRTLRNVFDAPYFLKTEMYVNIYSINKQIIHQKWRQDIEK